MKPSIPEKLRVCFFSQRLPKRFRGQGGSTSYGYLWPLCRTLAAQGHDITVITAEADADGPLQTVDGVQIHRLESPIPGEFSTTLRESILDRFEQLHVEKPFDLIHSVDNSGKFIIAYKKELGVPLGADISGIQLDQIFGLLGLTEDTVLSYLKTSAAVTVKFLKSFFGEDHRLLKSADGIFVASQQQKNILELYYLIPSRRVHVIPYGINPKELALPQGAPEIFKRKMKEWHVPAGNKIILTVTPLVSVEETKNLLTAFERVVIKKPDTTLIIAGEGPKRKDLEFHMLSLALASKVVFTETISPDEEDALIRGCDIYVNLSSKSSGFEGTVLEAMACGKTVIASEVGTSANLIQNGVDGFLLRPTEIAALTRLLLDAVSGQIDTAGIGSRACEKILKMFDTKAMVEETVRAYQTILKSTGKYRK